MHGVWFYFLLRDNAHTLLYVCLTTQGLGTTKFTNLLAEIDNESGLDFPIKTGI